MRELTGMYAPLVAAVVNRLVLREGWSDFGLRPSWRGSWRWSYIAAYLLPLGLVLLGAALSLVFGVQHWRAGSVAAALALWAARARHQSAASAPSGVQLMAIEVLVAVSVSVLITCLATLGEEFGWRGHLLPRLAPLGETPAALLSGLIWGLWHAPLIGLYAYEYGIRSWALVPFFCLFTVPFGVLLAWLRLRSGSTWPGVLAHATVNQSASAVLLFITVRPALLGAPIGLVGMAPSGRPR